MGMEYPYENCVMWKDGSRRGPSTECMSEADVYEQFCFYMKGDLDNDQCNKCNEVKLTMKQKSERTRLGQNTKRAERKADRALYKEVTFLKGEAKTYASEGK